MPRSAASIRTEMSLIEAQIPGAIAAASYSAPGRSKTNQTLQALTQRYDMLQMQLDRVEGTSPMLVRGVVRGLR